MCSTRNTKHTSRAHMVIILTRTYKKQELLGPSPFCGLLVFVFVLLSSFVFVCVRPILSVSLGCSFLIDPSDFSYVYYRFRKKKTIVHEIITTCMDYIWLKETKIIIYKNSAIKSVKKSKITVIMSRSRLNTRPISYIAHSTSVLYISYLLSESIHLYLNIFSFLP